MNDIIYKYFINDAKGTIKNEVQISESMRNWSF